MKCIYTGANWFSQSTQVTSFCMIQYFSYLTYQNTQFVFLPLDIMSEGSMRLNPNRILC